MSLTVMANGPSQGALSSGLPIDIRSLQTLSDLAAAPALSTRQARGVIREFPDMILNIYAEERAAPMDQFLRGGIRPDDVTRPSIAPHVLELITDEDLADGLARTPLEHHVIWSGAPYIGRTGSIRHLVLNLVADSWTPVSVRTLVMRAARLSEDRGVSPERVRGAIRMHQAADGTSYFLVSRTHAREFVAVTDIPRPAFGRRICAGQIVLRADGVRAEAVQTTS